MCCIFQPAFGCRTLQSLLEISFLGYCAQWVCAFTFLMSSSQLSVSSIVRNFSSYPHCLGKHMARGYLTFIKNDRVHGSCFLPNCLTLNLGVGLLLLGLHIWGWNEMMIFYFLKLQKSTFILKWTPSNSTNI